MENCWTVIGLEDSHELPTQQDIKTALEKGSDAVKIDTMRKLLGCMLNGDLMPQLTMHVIRFVLPSKNKQLKKLLLVYWEICPKKNPDGKLRQEMILVCNYLRNDLQSPNEFVRAATLKLLTKLKEPELLEPLLPSCRSCLENRHANVRRNAIYAILTIYKQFEHLIPDAPEILFDYLKTEADSGCKRAAFVALCAMNPTKAGEYLLSVFDMVGSMDELFQLAVIDYIRKDSTVHSDAKSRYIRCVLSLLTTPSSTVKFDACSALTQLTSSPSAIKEIGQTYIELALKESDNNVKLIVLDRLDGLRKRHEKVLDDLAMDVLRVLTSPDIAVCKKAIQIVLEMLASKNIAEVIAFLKKEVAKTHHSSNEKNLEYRQLLIHAIHSCAIKFPDAAAEVVYILMEFLTTDSQSSAVDVIYFVREVMERNEKLRQKILESLMTSFSGMAGGKVIRGALWILGEYSTDLPTIEGAFKEISRGIGELPIVQYEQRMLDDLMMQSQQSIEEDNQQPEKRVQTRVLADGTYATESVFSTVSPTTAKQQLTKGRPPLKSVIMGGDYFVASVLGQTLVKLVFRLQSVTKEKSLLNAKRAEAMLILTSLIRLGKSHFVTVQIDEDTEDRLLTCLKLLSRIETAAADIQNIFMNQMHSVYSKLLQTKEQEAFKKESKLKMNNQVDEKIPFRQLMRQQKTQNDLEMDLLKATGETQELQLTNRLNRMIQLSGFSDPVYCECFVQVHQYDVILEILIVNQTMETLHNLTLDFVPTGDLKIVEKPSCGNLGPNGFWSGKAVVKVMSADQGVLYGNILYDSVGGQHQVCVCLNEVQFDILDYLKPDTCPENDFRAMWVEFEWENKIVINTNIKDLNQFLDHILSKTNMQCLTPKAKMGNCGFLACNLYAKSIFGEHALANLCLEQADGQTISGHVRIRSKTQGIALSLGDKFSNCQRIKV